MVVWIWCNGKQQRQEQDELLCRLCRWDDWWSDDVGTIIIALDYSSMYSTRIQQWFDYIDKSFVYVVPTNCSSTVAISGFCNCRYFKYLWLLDIIFCLIIYFISIIYIILVIMMLVSYYVGSRCSWKNDIKCMNQKVRTLYTGWMVMDVANHNRGLIKYRCSNQRAMFFCWIFSNCLSACYVFVHLCCNFFFLLRLYFFFLTWICTE